MLSLLRTGFLFTFLILSGITSGQDKPQYSVFLIDSSLLENADAVIRSEDTRYTIRNPREYMCEITKVVSIFSAETGETQLKMPYGKYSTAELVHATIYDAFGNVLRKIKKSELLDVAAYDGVSILSSERITGIDVSGGRLPFTIEYSWRLLYHETMYYPPWSPQMSNVSIEKASFILDAPENLVIHTRILNYDFGYVNEKLNGRLKQTWQLSNYPAIEREVSGPPAHELFPMLILSPSVFTVENYTGSMSNWNSFGSFLYELNKGKKKCRLKWRSESGKSPPPAKPGKKRLTRCIGGCNKTCGTSVSSSALEDGNRLTPSMSRKTGTVTARPSRPLCAGCCRKQGSNHGKRPSKRQKKKCTTIRILPFRILTMSCCMFRKKTCGSNAPAISGLQERLPRMRRIKWPYFLRPMRGKIVRTPLSERGTNQVYTVDTIWITDHIRLKGQKRMHGHAQDEILSDYYYASAEDQRKNFLESLPIAVDKLEQFKLDVDPGKRESVATYTAALRQYGNSSGVRYFLPVSSLYPLPYTCPANKARKSDYLSRYEYSETNDSYISIPQGYTIEYLPPPAVFSFEGNNFALEITAENNFLHLHQFRMDIPMRLTPAQYSGWCTYLSNVSKAKNQMIVLKKED